MKKILILIFILFCSNVLAHMDHYKKYNKIEMDIFRNGELIGYNYYFFKKNGDETLVANQIKFSVKLLGATIFQVEGYGEEKYIQDANNPPEIIVKFFKGVFITGQFFSIAISSILTLSFANGTLSKAPGASNLLKRDLATSISGEIITSIGIADLLYNLLHLLSKKSFVLIRAIFLLILNKELAN